MNSVGLFSYVLDFEECNPPLGAEICIRHETRSTILNSHPIGIPKWVQQIRKARSTRFRVHFFILLHTASYGLVIRENVGHSCLCICQNDRTMFSQSPPFVLSFPFLLNWRSPKIEKSSGRNSIIRFLRYRVWNWQ